MAAAWHGDPDLTRQLGGQPVKLECGEQAEHGLWHPGGDKGKTLEFRYLCAWQTVKTTPDPFQQSCGSHAREDDPGRADGVQIAGAQQPSLASQIKDALGVGLGEH
ncbi:succinate dehydrogenase flavoprotein subunit [Burkholderiales bacterium GJ-E10]|nr:succinate dehydrogenase flavoprotein subunit [Burkholderiales bacterium GJ-E10]